MTGGFGTYAEMSYDANSYNGINFFKADNITPLGLHSTCGTTYVASESTNINGYNVSYSFLDIDSDTGLYKTIFAGWWDVSKNF